MTCSRGRVSLVGARPGAVLTLALLSACAGEEPVNEAVEAPPEGLHGLAAPAANGVRSVVLLWPVGDFAALPERRAPVIDQFGLVFSPERLIVDAGGTMRFHNSEADLSHNVQVWPLGASTPILDADALPNDVIEFTPEPGAYDILCDEHPGMRSFVFVTDAPFAVFAEEDGSFDFGQREAGTYEIAVWTVTDGLGPRRPIELEGSRTRVDMRTSAEGPAE